MTSCPGFGFDGPNGIADALRGVDCAAGQATASAFGRLFGADGALGTALTLLLTIYIALLAINLLSGRSRLSLSMLTPRMMALGLVLTFATSWVAYQSMVWNLAMGAPDEIASLLIGSHGSATELFANRLDTLFAAVADAAQAADAAGTTDKAASVSPADLLWLAALMLLLGTVGMLIVARIALAALLALGPIFILFALFSGTRGLFEGWLKGVVLFAIIPLLTVLIGGGALTMMGPVISGLTSMSGTVPMRAAVTVFLAAAVYVALMAIVLKVATTLTAGWRLPVLMSSDRGRMDAAAPALRITAPPSMPAVPPSQHAADQARITAIVGTLQAPANDVRTPPPDDRARTIVATLPPAPAIAAPRVIDDRTRGIGSRFRPPAASISKEILS